MRDIAHPGLLLAGGNRFVVLPTLLEHAIIFGWPTLLTVVLVAAASRRRRLQVTSAFAVVVGGQYPMQAPATAAS